MNPQSCVACEVGDVDSHATVWPMELGTWTPTFWSGPSRWEYGLPQIVVSMCNPVRVKGEAFEDTTKRHAVFVHVFAS